LGTRDRRAQNVAALGFLLTLATLATLIGVAWWSKSDAVGAVARLTAAGLPVWLILFLLFKQLRRVHTEALETAELQQAQAAGSTSLFEVDAESLLIEQGRLQWMVRWMLPSVTVLLTVYLLAGQLIGWSWSPGEAMTQVRRTQNPTLMMWFVVGAGFLCFLYARYTLALARLPEWRLLHAGGAFMAGNALACLGLVLAMMAGTAVTWVEPVLAYAMRAFLLVLGVEFAVNFVMDFYRPRTPGEVPRPSFDSRFLGLVSDPGGIAKSIADTINYQFGFEVSSTWFYQLLQRWLFPIMVLTAVVIVGMSSLVVVAPHEAAVVERLGRRTGGENAVLSPGLHFKLPWPIEIVHRAPVRQIQELLIGEATEDDEDPSKAIAWTDAHEFVPELMLLVASPQLAGPTREEASAGVAEGSEPRSVAVSLLMVSVPIEYRIKDITRYLYRYTDPLKLMEAVAYQFLSDYAAGVDIDELMGPGRDGFNQELRLRLQEKLDAMELGVEIAFAGIRSAHPPKEEKVAATFQEVISARIRMDAIIRAAEGEAQRILTAVAGTENRAKALDEVLRTRDRIAHDPAADPAERADIDSRINELMFGNPRRGIQPMSGNAAAIIADARAETSEWMSQEAAKAQSFEAEVAAYAAAPRLYERRRMLDLYSNLDLARKYLIVGDPSNVVILYDTAEQGGLDRVLSEGLEKERAKSGP
jgi:membrane protease subunit HflK